MTAEAQAPILFRMGSGGADFVARPEELRSVTAPEIQCLAELVRETSQQVVNISVNERQSGNHTATNAVSAFVASASSDASSIGRVLDEDAEHVTAAARTYRAADEASASSYEELLRNSLPTER